jgi:hypothetical protein
MTRSSGLCLIQVQRSGTTASITTSSTRKAVQVIQLSAKAIASSAPPGCDSESATLGITKAAAISIGVASRSATRVLRSSIPGLKRAGVSVTAELTPSGSTCPAPPPLCANSVTSLEVRGRVWLR